MTMYQVIALTISATSLFFLLVLWIALGITNIKEKRRNEREYFMEQLMRVSSEVEELANKCGVLEGRLDAHAEIIADLWGSIEEMEEKLNAKKKSNR